MARHKVQSPTLLFGVCYFEEIKGHPQMATWKRRRWRLPTEIRNDIACSSRAHFDEI
jgi:hypothetical protein